MDLTAPFTALFTFIKNIALWSLDGLLWIIKTAFFLCLDGILLSISLFFHALDFAAFLGSYAMSWAGLPEQFIWFINAVGVPQGIAILIPAIGIRMALNLIPSWATRI